MALGFRDCCNEFSYFLVLGIPATVSENETYYIQTTQGFNFCATYVEIPPLNYQPPTYNLSQMTEQTNCSDVLCLDVCTNDENIILDEFLAGSVSEGVDCEVLTLVPMTAECVVVNPTFDNVPDGVVSVSVRGGRPPYTFLNSNTNSNIAVNNLAAGNYTLQYSDANYTQSITCTVTQPALVNYPDVFCLSFNFCGTFFQLSFVEDSSFYNYRAQYVCINPGIIGLTQMRIRWETSLNRWASVQQTSVTSNIQFTGPTGNCSYGNGVVYFLGPVTSTTPIGSYQGSGGMFSTVLALAAVGYCPPSVSGQITRSYCPATNTLANITLQAQGGTGVGYIYYYSNDNGASYQQSLSPILTNLMFGTYLIYVKDSGLNTSSQIQIIIPNTPYSFNIVSSSSCGLNRWVNTHYTQTGTIATMITNPGEYRQNTAEITLWIDFGYIPQGNTVNGSVRFKVNFATRGGEFDVNPLLFQVSQFEVPFAQVKQNGNNVNIMQNPTVLYTNIPTYTGPTNFYEPNAGHWNTTGHSDGCAGGATGRLSPNWWEGCSAPRDPAASFIENDRNAKEYTNEIIITSSNFDINSNTKFGLTFKLTQRMNSIAYAPTIRLETDGTTLSPSFVNPIQQSQLNVQNINPVKYAGTKSQASITIDIVNLVVKDGCVTLPAGNKVNLIVLDTNSASGSFTSTSWLNSSVANPPFPSIALSSPWVGCNTVPDWFA